MAFNLHAIICGKEGGLTMTKKILMALAVFGLLGCDVVVDRHGVSGHKAGTYSPQQGVGVQNLNLKAGISWRYNPATGVGHAVMKTDDERFQFKTDFPYHKFEAHEEVVNGVGRIVTRTKVLRVLNNDAMTAEIAITEMPENSDTIVSVIFRDGFERTVGFFVSSPTRNPKKREE